MREAKFHILRHQPYSNRSEHINIGLVVILDDGTFKIHLAKNLKKLKAFDPEASGNRTYEQVVALETQLNKMRGKLAYVLLKNLGAWRISDNAGFFSYDNPDEYDEWVSRMLVSTVEPRKRNRAELTPNKGNRLLIEVRQQFELHGWLGKSTGEIRDHKIISRFPVSLDCEVYADFAYKNGKLNIIETLDFRNIANPSEKKRETHSKAFVFDFAARLGKVAEDGVRGTVIFADSDYKGAKPMIKVLQQYADDMICWESDADIRRFLDETARAIKQPMIQMSANNDEIMKN